MLEGLGPDIVWFYLKSQDPRLIAHPEIMLMLHICCLSELMGAQHRVQIQISILALAFQGKRGKGSERSHLSSCDLLCLILMRSKHRLLKVMSFIINCFSSFPDILGHAKHHGWNDETYCQQKRLLYTPLISPNSIPHPFLFCNLIQFINSKSTKEWRPVGELVSWHMLKG